MIAKLSHALPLILLATALPTQATYVVDSSFSGDGEQTIAFDLDTFKADQALEIFPAAGGGYYVTGIASTSAQSGVALGIVKLTATGALDASFDADGKISIETLFTTLADVAMDAQGRMVFVGTIAENPGPGTDIAVMRVLPNGSVDGLFGFFGISGDDAYDFDQPKAVAVTPDAHIVVLRHGRNDANALWSAGVSVFENDGSTSTGLLIGASHASTDDPSGAIVWSAQRNRAVIAFDGLAAGNCIVRAYEINVFLNGSGSIQASNTGVGAFNMPGVSACSSQASVQAITAAANGSLFIAGHIINVANPGSGNLQGWVMKITAADALDSSFDSDGVSYQFAPFPLQNLRFTSLALDGSGRVLAGGTVSNTNDANVGFAAQRLTTTGAADTSFANGLSSFLTAYFTVSGGGDSARNLGRSLLIDGSRILLAGSMLWTVPVDFDFAIAAWREPSSAPLIFADGFE
jgi:uncharacterized delta-60 repeat protein